MIRGRSAVARQDGIAVAVGLAVALACGAATASVRRSGSWPAIEHELVSFSAEHLPRAEAIRRLADRAGWSVVVQGAASGTVDVRVTKQPAVKVLELILGDGNYLVKRDGALVSIAPVGGKGGDGTGDGDGDTADGDGDGDGDGETTEGAAAAAAASSAGKRGAAPALAGAKGEARPHGKDRVVIGESLTISRDEVVGDLVVMGGTAQILGRVSGDVSVFAGSVHVREGGHVFGDVATFGGSVSLDQGAQVDGDLSVIGGSIDRNAKAIVGGHSKGDGQHEGDDSGDQAGDPTQSPTQIPTQTRHTLSFQTAASSVGNAITRTALLFAFGAVLWALAGRRIERLQDEVAARPMRAFAIGLVGMLAAALALVVLCVTVIGIPIALVAGLVGVFGAYAGVCAALTTVGAALVRHRTQSPYVHLALGCAAYLLLSSIPFVGQFVTTAVALIGFGALVVTRGAGLIPRRRGPTGGEAA